MSIDPEDQVVRLDGKAVELLNGQIVFLVMVGRGGLEPPTSRLSGVRSNHLSYRPILLWMLVERTGSNR